jgi:CheY-like chemotaxis protein
MAQVVLVGEALLTYVDRRARMKGSGLDILYVEDHVDTAEAIATLLRASGHRVLIAPTAAVARAVVEDDEHRRLDLYICDIGLPDADGCDLLRDLVAKRPLPAIALTAHAFPADAQRCRDAGYVTHLPKPIEFRQLLDAIREAMPPHG